MSVQKCADAGQGAKNKMQLGEISWLALCPHNPPNAKSNHKDRHNSKKQFRRTESPTIPPFTRARPRLAELSD
jgi:hypothetical protein